MKSAPVAGLALLFLCGCAHTLEPRPEAEAAAVTASRSRAGDDFFDYANADWLRAHPIPEDRVEYGMFTLAEEIIERDMDRIDREAAAAAGTDAEARRLTDFMRAAEAAQRRDGFPLPPTMRAHLAELDAAGDRAAVLLCAAKSHRAGGDAFWGFGCEQSVTDSDLMQACFWQGGLTLPDRDYYLVDEPALTRVRAAFPAHVSRMLTRLGYAKDRADDAAGRVAAFETRLAEISAPLADLREPERTHHPMTLAQLDVAAPGLPWAGVFALYGMPADRPVNLATPDFFQKLAALVAVTPVETLKDYARFHAADAIAEHVSAEGVADHFAFHGRVLAGAQAPKPARRRALRDRDAVMGEAVGRRYVALRFPEERRARYTAMFEAVRAAFLKRIEANTWMDAPTRARASEKLRAMRFKIGHPDRWTDFSALAVTPDHAENMLAGARFAFDRDFAQVGGPPDRDRWAMSPHTYNAYYAASNNELVFPAATFLIPGHEDGEVDDAAAYGFIAVVVGHEITHGFDDQGRKYDAKGNLHDWWSAASAQAFERKSSVLVARYGAEEPLPGFHIKGDMTLGENLADLGGLAIGLDAFKQTACYRSGVSIGGETPLQRFFLAYARSWAGASRPEHLRRSLLSDTHSPAKARVNLIVQNFDEFHEAFGTKPGDKLWLPPAERVRIW